MATTYGELAPEAGLVPIEPAIRSGTQRIKILISAPKVPLRSKVEHDPYERYERA